MVLCLMGATVLLAAYLTSRKSKSKEKMRRKLSEARKTHHVPKHVIIIAIELDNLILFYSEKYHPDYRLLVGKEESLSAKLMNYMTNDRPCFLLRFTRRAIRLFFRELKAVENIKLVLYTRIPRELCIQILEDLNI